MSTTKENKKQRSFILSFLCSSAFLNTVFWTAVIFPVCYTVFRIKYLAGKTIWGIAGFFFCLALGSLTAFFIIRLCGGRDKFADKLKNNRFSFLAMAIAAAIMLFAFAVYSVVPFGDYTVLKMDLYHQYGPMFGELYDRVVEDKSLFYSLQAGGGNEFLGNFYNYLSSPVSLIIFWFERKHLVNAIAYIIFIKCALSAGTFVFYIKKHFGKAGGSSVAFALFYAFSAYFIAYYWNLMWLDAVVLIPIVIFGIEQIIDNKKSRYYVTGLVLTMLTNYYMSYMVCIFSVIYFLVYYFSKYSLTQLYIRKSSDVPLFSKIYQSRFLNTGVVFALASIFAALLSAFALLPIYFALKNSSATSSAFPDSFELYFNVFDFIANHLAGTSPTIRSSGDGVQPNVYCGILTIMLIPLYAISKHISAKKKIVHIGLLAVFLVSFNTNFLNFIWHGFHFPNDLPYRFSFIYSFVLLVMAYTVFCNIEQFSKKIIVGTGIGFLCAIVLIQKLETNYTDDFAIYVSIAFTAVYTLLLLAIISKKIAKSIVGIVVICAAVTEVLISDVPRMNFAVTEESYISDYDDCKQVVTAVQDMDDSAYRMEFSNVPNLLRMSPSWYNYNGINCFSSMEYESTSELQFNLGMFGNKLNSFTYYTQTPVYNAMFGLKYIIQNDSQVNPNEKLYAKILSDVGKLKTYKNNYFLPPAFAVKSTLANYWDTQSSNPFEVQNNFIKEATGIEEDVFKPIQVELGGCTNCYVSGFDSSVQNNFTVTDTESYAAFVTMFDVPKTANVYLYYGTRSLSDIDITTEEYNIQQTIGVEPYILDLGELQKSEKVSINANVSDDADEGWFYTYAYYLDESVWEKAYNLLKGGEMKITEFDDTSLKGEIELDSSQIIYTSISYDEGWSAYVDGKKAPVVKIADTFLGVKANSGDREVVLKYTPKGLKAGIIISAAAVFSAGMYEILKWFIVRKIRDFIKKI